MSSGRYCKPVVLLFVNWYTARLNAILLVCVRVRSLLMTRLVLSMKTAEFYQAEDFQQGSCRVFAPLIAITDHLPCHVQSGY